MEPRATVWGVDYAELADLPRAERNGHLLDLARARHFDFLDFGSHKGGGFEVGRFLGGAHGLGVEIDDGKVVRALRDGLPVYSGDIVTFPSDGMHFKFAVSRHILEHMPSTPVVGSVLAKLMQVCTDFLYIEGPSFDDTAYLDSLGLTLVQSTLEAHTCRITSRQFVALVRALGATNILVGRQHPMADSQNKWVHLAGSPPNRWIWNDDDIPKPLIKFDRLLYRDIIILAGLRDDIDLRRVAEGVKLFRPMD